MQAEAVSSFQRILRRVRDKHHSGDGGEYPHIGEWEHFMGEEGMGFKLLNEIHHCNIVMDRRQRVRNKWSEGVNNEDPMTVALDPRGWRGSGVLDNMIFVKSLFKSSTFIGFIQ